MSAKRSKWMCARKCIISSLTLDFGPRFQNCRLLLQELYHLSSMSWNLVNVLIALDFLTLCKCEVFILLTRVPKTLIRQEGWHLGNWNTSSAKCLWIVQFQQSLSWRTNSLFRCTCLAETAFWLQSEILDLNASEELWRSDCRNGETLYASLFGVLRSLYIICREYSTQLNASRLKLLQAQDDLVRKMKEAAEKQLQSVGSKSETDYADILKALIIQVHDLYSLSVTHCGYYTLCHLFSCCHFLLVPLKISLGCFLDHTLT